MGGSFPGSTVPPPNLAGIAPLLTVWPMSERLWRVHTDGRMLAFHPGYAQRPARFSPFTPAGEAGPVPVLYAARTVGGALSETIFHDVGTSGSETVPAAKLAGRFLSQIEVARDLTLVDLTSDGLMRLHLARTDLIDTSAVHYPRTQQWARALHAHVPTADGLLWTSRLQDTSAAVVLFGDRVAPTDIGPAGTKVALPLTVGSGPGYDLAAAAANRAGITIAEP